MWLLSPEEVVCLSDGHELMERHVSLRSRNLPSGWATSWGSVVPTFESESRSEGPASTEDESQRPTSPDGGGSSGTPVVGFSNQKLCGDHWRCLSGRLVRVPHLPQLPLPREQLSLQLDLDWDST